MSAYFLLFEKSFHLTINDFMNSRLTRTDILPARILGRVEAPTLVITTGWHAEIQSLNESITAFSRLFPFLSPQVLGGNSDSNRLPSHIDI